MSYCGLRLAVKKCGRLLARIEEQADGNCNVQSAVINFKAKCAERLHADDFQFECSLLIPYGKKLRYPRKH